LEEVMLMQKLYIEELERCVKSSIALLRSTTKCLHALILLPLLILLFFNSIWNTYKDVFAKARTRELSIIA
jgi:hypothetical protein